MKKLLALPFILPAASLLIAGLLVIAIGGLILNGPAKTGQKLAELAKAIASLTQ
jgi:hypothetical protein